MDSSGPAPLLSTLAIPGYQPGSVNMDVDNRSIVFGVRGSASVTTLMNSMRSGLFRHDPVTTRLTTIYRHVVGTTAYHAFYQAVVDYNGDYVTAVYNFDSTKNLGQYEIWKVDRSGQCTTLLTSVQAGLSHPWGLYGHVRINAVTMLTLGNLIPAIWSGGPGILDANGEAQGYLDLSMTSGLGVPIWMAWIVLDPAAPLGIAYVPDTYVLRV
jgi:hypothetical protein